MRTALRHRFGTLLPLLAAILLFISDAAQAESANALQISMDEKVVYCAAAMNSNNEHFGHALKDGISVATVWHFKVAKVREYWLNKTIAKISVVRRVVPDLLSRSWLLEDEASGISRRVYDIGDATRFLAVLEKLPVIDRTLLEADEPYMMSTSVQLYTGDVNDAWWANLMKSNEAEMEMEFMLP